MKEPTLGSPQNTIAVLQKYNFVFQKKFGQNFLIDTRVLDKIIRSAEITKDDFVLEIGPGIGTMTQYLACAAGKVVAVEIDRALIPILADTLDGYDNVTVINEDVLKVDIAKLAEEQNGGRPIKIVANLPYYITTPIIMGLFEKNVPIKSITVMVQKGRRKWRTGCRWDPGRKITGRSPWQCSIMRNHISWQMSRRTVSCPGPRWARRSSAWSGMRSRRCR